MILIQRVWLVSSPNDEDGYPNQFNTHSVFVGNVIEIAVEGVNTFDCLSYNGKHVCEFLPRL